MLAKSGQLDSCSYELRTPVTLSCLFLWMALAITRIHQRFAKNSFNHVSRKFLEFVNILLVVAKSPKIILASTKSQSKILSTKKTLSLQKTSMMSQKMQSCKLLQKTRCTLDALIYLTICHPNVVYDFILSIFQAVHASTWKILIMMLPYRSFDIKRDPLVKDIKLTQTRLS